MPLVGGLGYFGGKAKCISFDADFAAIGLLGGIGFTVSLLMSQLAFRDGETDYAQAAFGVLLASLVAMTAGGWLVTIRSKHHRKIAQQARKLAED